MILWYVHTVLHECNIFKSIVKLCMKLYSAFKLFKTQIVLYAFDQVNSPQCQFFGEIDTKRIHIDKIKYFKFEL